MRYLLAATLVALVPSAANAGTIDFLGMGKAEVVTVAGVRNVRAWAGEMRWEWVGTTNDFYSYCVDLLNNEMDPQYNVTVKSTDSLLTTGMVNTPYAAQKAAWLFDTYATAAHNADTGAMAAGLQLAIWEVLFDDGHSLLWDNNGSNTFYVTAASSAALAAGADYLKALNTWGTDYQHASATWLDVPLGQGQDQITRTPEPATLLLLGTGFAGLVTRRRAQSQV